MKKFSALAKGAAAVLIAAGLLAGTTAPASAAPSSQRVAVYDTGWG